MDNLSKITNYIKEHIDVSAVLKFASNHKVAVVAASSFLLYGAWFLKRPRNLPPGPYGYPVVGSLSVFSTDIHKTFNDLAEKYGDVFCLWLGSDNYLVVLNSYDAIKEAFITRGSDFADRINKKDMKGFCVKDTLFTSGYDDSYKSSRKIIAQAIRTMLSTKMDSVVQDEMVKITNYVEQQNDMSDIDISVPLSRGFTNVMSMLLFNKNYAHGDPTLDKYVEDVNRWVEKYMGVFFVEFYPRWLTFLKAKEVQDVRNETDYLIEVITEHISEHRSSSNKEIVDVVDAYLTAEDKHMFPPDTIAGTILVLMPDAVHTSVYMLLWVLVYLLNYPKYQKDIYEEIEKLKGDSRVLVSDRSKMPVTESFIMEVFRIVNPIAFGVGNWPIKTTTFRGYNIPKHVKLIPHLQNAHFDPKYFPEPHLFKPERFVKDGKIINAEGFIPFGLGRRMCIGEPIVRNEIFLFLTSLIQKYSITPGSNGTPGFVKDITSVIPKPEKFTVKLERR